MALVGGGGIEERPRRVSVQWCHYQNELRCNSTGLIAGQKKALSKGGSNQHYFSGIFSGLCFLRDAITGRTTSK